MPRAWLFGIPLVALLLGLFVGVVVGPRLQLQERERAREQQQRERLQRAGRAVSSSSTGQLLRGADGGVTVEAEVVAGRDGRLALDAHADEGSEEVLVPEVQTDRLLPTAVRAGERVQLERHLRRVRPGEPDAFTLRFSCRPPGPQGLFGVVEYGSAVTAEGPDEGGGLLRPLAAAGPVVPLTRPLSPPEPGGVGGAAQSLAGSGSAAEDRVPRSGGFAGAAHGRAAVRPRRRVDRVTGAPGRPRESQVDAGFTAGTALAGPNRATANVARPRGETTGGLLRPRARQSLLPVRA